MPGIWKLASGNISLRIMKKVQQRLDGKQLNLHWFTLKRGLEKKIGEGVAEWTGGELNSCLRIANAMLSQLSYRPERSVAEWRIQIQVFY